MEESKLRTHRRSQVGPARPARRGALASTSNHVIDLRATSKPAPATAEKARPAGRLRRIKAPRRPLAAPNQPVASAAPAAQLMPVSQPKPVAAPLVSTSAAPTPLEPSLSPRRFWPAFWRFLVLLIILGLLVTGGIYLYINYYRG